MTLRKILFLVEDDDIDVGVEGYEEIKKERVAQALLTLEDLGPDDEIWTVNVPRHVR